MSKIHKRGSATPGFNMTPLIDVTFQLVIFFLLTNSIATEQAVAMRVPVLHDPQTVEMAENTGAITINLVPHKDAKRDPNDPLKFDSRIQWVKVGLTDLPFTPEGLGKVTDMLVDARNKTNRRDEQGNPMVEVILRADAGAHFGQVRDVMTAILAAKIPTIKMAAYLPGEQPR